MKRSNWLGSTASWWQCSTWWEADLDVQTDVVRRWRDLGKSRVNIKSLQFYKTSVNLQGHYGRALGFYCQEDNKSGRLRKLQIKRYIQRKNSPYIKVTFCTRIREIQHWITTRHRNKLVITKGQKINKKCSLTKVLWWLWKISKHVAYNWAEFHLFSVISSQSQSFPLSLMCSSEWGIVENWIFDPNYELL